MNDFAPDEFGPSLLSFLESDELRSALPELGRLAQSEPTLHPLGFARSPSDGLTLGEEFSQVLVDGGAYQHFMGKTSEAKAIGVAACKDLFGERYDTVRVYRSDIAWSDYFYDVAYDVSWLVLDDSTQEVTLICVTDTD